MTVICTTRSYATYAGTFLIVMLINRASPVFRRFRRFRRCLVHKPVLDVTGWGSNGERSPPLLLVFVMLHEATPGSYVSSHSTHWYLTGACGLHM